MKGRDPKSDFVSSMGKDQVTFVCSRLWAGFGETNFDLEWYVLKFFLETDKANISPQQLERSDGYEHCTQMVNFDIK